MNTEQLDKITAAPKRDVDIVRSVAQALVREFKAREELKESVDRLHQENADLRARLERIERYLDGRH